MPPIRVGIVGLSSKPDTWAARAHLPALLASPHYQLVALCNSSLASARAAIAAHGLPASTRAYDSYDALAADPAVDLYVVCTRVDTHHAAALPALRAGRPAVFVEWPLGASPAEAHDLAATARAHGARTMIGFQGRASPTLRHLKALVDGGAVGVVHSANYHGAAGIWQGGAANARYGYMLDRRVGGNLATIYGGHVLDALQFVLGELVTGSYTPLAANLRPRMRVRQADGTITEETVAKDTPDQLLLQGRVARGEDPPAVLSVHLRAGDAFVGEAASTWRVYGSRGELVVEFATAAPHLGPATSVRLADFETGEVRVLEPEGKEDEGEGEGAFAGLPPQARNVARLYEAFARGEGYADFETAVRRHELVEEFWGTM